MDGALDIWMYYSNPEPCPHAVAWDCGAPCLWCNWLCGGGVTLAPWPRPASVTCLSSVTNFVLIPDWFVTHTLAAEVWLLCVSFSMKLEILMNREAEDNELWWWFETFVFASFVTCPNTKVYSIFQSISMVWSPTLCVICGLNAQKNTHIQLTLYTFMDKWDVSKNLRIIYP